MKRLPELLSCEVITDATLCKASSFICFNTPLSSFSSIGFSSLTFSGWISKVSSTAAVSTFPC
jgi:hypothetical protein